MLAQEIERVTSERWEAKLQQPDGAWDHGLLDYISALCNAALPTNAAGDAGLAPTPQELLVTLHRELFDSLALSISRQCTSSGDALKPRGCGEEPQEVPADGTNTSIPMCKCCSNERLAKVWLACSTALEAFYSVDDDAIVIDALSFWANIAKGFFRCTHTDWASAGATRHMHNLFSLGKPCTCAIISQMHNFYRLTGVCPFTIPFNVDMVQDNEDTTASFPVICVTLLLDFDNGLKLLQMIGPECAPADSVMQAAVHAVQLPELWTDAGASTGSDAVTNLCAKSGVPDLGSVLSKVMYNAMNADMAAYVVAVANSMIESAIRYAREQRGRDSGGLWNSLGYANLTTFLSSCTLPHLLIQALAIMYNDRTKDDIRCLLDFMKRLCDRDPSRVIRCGCELLKPENNLNPIFRSEILIAMRESIESFLAGLPLEDAAYDGRQAAFWTDAVMDQLFFIILQDPAAAVRRQAVRLVTFVALPDQSPKARRLLDVLCMKLRDKDREVRTLAMSLLLQLPAMLLGTVMLKSDWMAFTSVGLDMLCSNARNTSSSTADAEAFRSMIALVLKGNCNAGSRDAVMQALYACESKHSLQKIMSTEMLQG